MKLPAYSVLLLNGKMKGDFGEGWCGEELIEGGEMVGESELCSCSQKSQCCERQG